MNRFRLDGRLAVVTGAARGIGAAIAEGLAGQGARVVLSDVNPDVAATAAALGAAAHPFDVTDSTAVDDAAAAIEATHGPVDILVANAGVVNESPTETHPDADWRRVMEVNLDGVFWCIRGFGRAMLARGRGSIIAISSIAGVKAVRPELHAGYDVSKAGVAHLARVVGVEWAGRGVRVNAVGPGYTDTDMLRKVGLTQPEVMARWLDDIPMRRLLAPREIADTVAFLASDAASGITGQLIMADAGYSAA